MPRTSESNQCRATHHIIRPAKDLLCAVDTAYRQRGTCTLVARPVVVDDGFGRATPQLQQRLSLRLKGGSGHWQLTP